MSQSQLLVDSPVGPLLLVASGDELTQIWFDGDRRATAGASPDATVRAAADQLAEYFAGERHDFDLPMRAEGRPLQHRIWDALGEVPWGTTITYGELADRAGMPPGSARAVGSAMGSNPLPVSCRATGSSGPMVC